MEKEVRDWIWKKFLVGEVDRRKEENVEDRKEVFGLESSLSLEVEEEEEKERIIFFVK